MTVVWSRPSKRLSDLRLMRHWLPAEAGTSPPDAVALPRVYDRGPMSFSDADADAEATTSTTCEGSKALRCGIRSVSATLTSSSVNEYRADPICDHAGKRPLQFANVRLELARNHFQDNRFYRATGCVRLLCARWRCEFLDQAAGYPQSTPFKPRSQAFLRACSSPWAAVGRNDDLLILTMESVKSMEEFFLVGFLTSDKLNVIHEQDVNPAVAVREKPVYCECVWR
jgi:hypothetical protein